MIVVVTVVKGNSIKSNIFGVYSDDNNNNGKVNKRRTIYGKVVGNGSVIENYVRCGSSCNNHNLG